MHALRRDHVVLAVDADVTHDDRMQRGLVIERSIDVHREGRRIVDVEGDVAKVVVVLDEEKDAGEAEGLEHHLDARGREDHLDADADEHHDEAHADGLLAVLREDVPGPHHQDERRDDPEHGGQVNVDILAPFAAEGAVRIERPCPVGDGVAEDEQLDEHDRSDQDPMQEQMTRCLLMAKEQASVDRTPGHEGDIRIEGRREQRVSDEIEILRHTEAQEPLRGGLWCALIDGRDDLTGSVDDQDEEYREEDAILRLAGAPVHHGESEVGQGDEQRRDRDA